MPPIPLPTFHALAAPAHPDWCTLFLPFCHQPAPKTGIFDVGYGGTLVSTPFTDSCAYHSGYNGGSVESGLGMSQGTNAGATADQERSSALLTTADNTLAPRREADGAEAGLSWVDGATALAEAVKDHNQGQGVTKRGETVQAIAWAAAIAGTKYIIKESFKAGGRQIYRAFHKGDTEGLAGTMFEKAPYQPYSWELQAIGDEKERVKAWEVIQREEAAAEERRKLEVRESEEEVEGGEVEGDGGKGQEDIFRVEDVYLGDAWDEVRRENQ